MASTPDRNEEKKGGWPSQAAASLSGRGPKVSISCSEEFLTRISTELTNEALFIAHSHTSPAPTKEKQMKDQGTQISRHSLTDTAATPRHTFCHPFKKREHFPTT
uniref:CDIP transferase, opposite strand n=1 Tax=Nannospalax galili TaxID=1026970 RepID=A0A8C6WA96_NANGA